MLETNLVNMIYNLLKEKIINCELEMGQRIDIKNIAHDFAVSQTPVREVVNRLMKDGLITSIPRKGYFVVKLDVKDLEEIYDLRRIIECYALESAIDRLDTCKLQELLKNAKSLKEKVKNVRKVKESHYLKDIELHMMIVQSSPNRRLREIYSQLFDIIRIILKIAAEKSEHEKSLEENIQLLEAMIEKNLTKAKKILNIHINNALDRVVSVFEKSL